MRLAHVEWPIKGCSEVEFSNRVVSNRPIQKCDCQNRGLQGTSLNRSTAGCSPSTSRPAALALAQRKRCQTIRVDSRRPKLNITAQPVTIRPRGWLPQRL